MNKFLSNAIKGALLAIVVVVLGGIIYLNINSTDSNILKLVSSSIVNSVKTDKEQIEESKEIPETKEEIQENNDIEKEEQVDIEDKKETVETKEVVEETNEEIKIEQKEENKKEVIEEQKETLKEVETPQEETIETKEPVKDINEYNPNLEVSNTTDVIATWSDGYITGYGPDCYGCTSGKTATGQNVTNGNIYYNDKTYGTVRIVAADKSIPFGSIIRIKNTSYSTDPIIAIVLDRGGDISFTGSKSIYFDLLFASEKDATVMGKQKGVYELLRSGY